MPQCRVRMHWSFALDALYCALASTVFAATPTTKSDGIRLVQQQFNAVYLQITKQFLRRVAAVN